ncbi:hypothetical protein CRUP_031267 [Coryphaenoides rupestris]|nr:hypothetical protein CRUP_031267 [Coryphaenoides rupestris]
MDVQRTGSVVPPQAPWRASEKQLSCPICLEMFTKPVVILPCQHNLCRSCASDLYDSPTPTASPAASFRCPTCRFEVVLDRHGVHGLQRNLLVENIIDIYKQQQEGTGGTGTAARLPGPEGGAEQLPSTRLVASNGRLQALLHRWRTPAGPCRRTSQRAKQSLAERFDLSYAVLEERKTLLLEHIGNVQDQKVATLRALAQRYGERLQASSELTDTAVRALGAGRRRRVSCWPPRASSRRPRMPPRVSLGEERPEPGFEKMDHFNPGHGA